MRKIITLFVSIALLSVGVLLFLNKENENENVVNKKEVKQKLLKASVPFIENKGQTDERVAFYSNTFGGTVFVTKEGTLVYSLPADEGKGWVIREEFPHAKDVKVSGKEKARTKVNIFKGENRIRNIPSYEVVSVGEVAEGVFLDLKAYGNNVEKLFYVKPGADPEKIAVKVEGGKGLKVNEKGELVVKTDYGEIRFTKPVAYQEVDGKRKYVEVSYALLDKDTYGFKVGEYDRSRVLVIDPLLASTFLGGTHADIVQSIAIDKSGNVYVAGLTRSSDFPTTAGAYQTTYGGGLRDAFISKLDSNLTTLIASTFLGGSNREYAIAITLDNSGNVYVAGSTSSSDFPTTPKAYQKANRGDHDAFISKLDSNLTTLIASTFLGGSNREYTNSITLDSSGNVYVAGKTNSSDFPTTAGAYQTTGVGAFISKFDSNLTTLIASTFLGSGDISSITLDNSGNVYVAGETNSSNFPTTAGAYQITYGGGDGDAFISKLDSNLTTLIASTFLGGSNREYTNSITLDSSGNVYVAGETNSSDFPTTAGAYQTTYGGGGKYWGDAFISKLDSNLTTLIASTFLGKSNDDIALSITLDSSGNVYVVGSTSSRDFPTTPKAYQTTYGGSWYDAFISKLDSNLTTLIASTFLGGSNSDSAIAITLDSSGNIYVAGSTSSRDFPTTPKAYQTPNGLHDDTFISKLDPNLSAESTEGQKDKSSEDQKDKSSRKGGCNAGTGTTFIILLLSSVFINLFKRSFN